MRSWDDNVWSGFTEHNAKRIGYKRIEKMDKLSYDKILHEPTLDTTLGQDSSFPYWWLSKV